MKKLIFKKFIKDYTQFFLVVSLSISLIVWVIQAVNFLDIVTEDGHGFKIYFLYTLLSLPKIFSKILPFVYFLSIYYIILKYENNNELLIFWTIGIKKIQFLNVLITFSIFYLILQLFLTTYIVPTTLNKARSFLKSSNIDLFESLIKEKKFIDAVKNLTIFVEEKNDSGKLKNIFLKENLGTDKYQIIFSKYGQIVNKDNKNILMLFNGKIINNNSDKTNTLIFSETELNLSKFSTHTTTAKKIQEVSTYEILACFILINDFKRFPIIQNLKNNDLVKSKIFGHNCSVRNLKISYQEIFKRIFLPLYLPILTLIASLIIIKSKDDYKFSRYKFLSFFTGVFIILISELSLKYYGENLILSASLISIPILSFIAIYFYFIKKFKISNLIKT